MNDVELDDLGLSEIKLNMNTEYLIQCEANIEKHVVTDDQFLRTEKRKDFLCLMK
jgi:hypothetical protein